MSVNKHAPRSLPSSAAQLTRAQERLTMPPLRPCGRGWEYQAMTTKGAAAKGSAHMKRPPNPRERDDWQSGKWAGAPNAKIRYSYTDGDSLTAIATELAGKDRK